MAIWLGSTIAATNAAWHGDRGPRAATVPSGRTEQPGKRPEQIFPSVPTTPTLPLLHADHLTVGVDEVVRDACFDWLDFCGGSYFASAVAQYQTIPMAYVPTVDDRGVARYRPGPVLAGPATLAVTPTQTITYDVSRAAKWSDGVPITCVDFQYTASEYMHSENLLDNAGYTDVISVTCATKRTVVVTFREGVTYAAWETLFTVILPSHILQGNLRHDEMQDGYGWSGGPFLIERFDDHLELTPNPYWWGTPSRFRVITVRFLPVEELTRALISGSVSAIISPQRAQDFGQIASESSINSEAAPLPAFVEALWMNNSIEPFNSRAVRRAVAFAIDRDDLVRQAWQGEGDVSVAQSLTPPIAAPYLEPSAWSRYQQDQRAVNQELTGDGWLMGSDGYWQRRGRRLSFVVDTTDNDRRATIEDAMVAQLRAAGIEMKIGAREADVFDRLGDGNYQAMLYAAGGTAEPSMCFSFCSENLPSPQHPEGQNQQRVNDPALDKLLRVVDHELDPEARRVAAIAADRYLADQQISLPLMTMPDVGAWNSRLTGPHMNSMLGLFWNLNEWTLNAPVT